MSRADLLGQSAPPIKAALLRALHGAGKAVGLDHEGLKIFAMSRYPVTSLNGLSQGEAKSLLKDLARVAKSGKLDRQVS